MVKPIFEPRHAKESSLLIVAFRPRLSLALVPEHVATQFWLDGMRCRDMGLGDMNGFYDWLRDASGSVLGIRFSPLEAARFVVDSALNLAYVTIDFEEPALDVYFTGRRDVDDQRPRQQDFGGNRIFSADSGEILVSFDTSMLEDSDFGDIRLAIADWMEARPLTS